MPTYKFEAMDTTGGEVKSTVDALNPLVPELAMLLPNTSMVVSLSVMR